MIRALLSACLFALATPAIAEDALLHFNGMRLVIEPLGAEAVACGLAEANIRQAFMYPVSSSKLQVSTKGNDPYFYIAIATTRPTQFGCSTALSIRVLNGQIVVPDYGEKLPVWGEVEVWSGGVWVLSAPIAEHARQVTQKVETAAKMFITDWNLANK
jgi:hypothetical protein